MTVFPNHETAWLWIVEWPHISIGLVIFRDATKREKEAIEEAKLYAEENKTPKKANNFQQQAY